MFGLCRVGSTCRPAGCTRPRTASTRRLVLEALENRWVPSTIPVTTLNDSGTGSLRQAILDANVATDPDIIQFAPGLSGTIQLATELPALATAIDLEGPGANVIGVMPTAGGQFRLFYVTGGANVTIAGLTIANGVSSARGGGILVDPGSTLAVNNCVVTACTAAGGAGISNSGTLTVSGSAITGNIATGTVTFVGVTPPGFLLPPTISTGGLGGGIRNDGALTLINSTVSQNLSTRQFVFPGHRPSLTFVPGEGAGVWNSDTTTLTIVNTTIAANTVKGGNGGGLRSGGSGAVAVQLLNTIVAQNIAQPDALGPGGSDPDVLGTFSSAGHNLIGDSTGAVGFTAAGDQAGTSGFPLDPRLGPLQSNGGPTPTMALHPDSPALNAGNDAVLGAPLSLATDQRGPGFARLQGTHVDIGAFEVSAAAAAFVVTGADAGAQPLVRGFDAAGNLLFSFLAFDAGFTGGVRVATADINGDGVPDIIAGAGPGAAPHVRVFSGADLSVLASFYAFAPTFAGGVFVAGGDFTGDGKADVVVSADAGADPHVEVLKGTHLGEVGGDGQISTSAVYTGFDAFDVGFHGGVRVAVGDVNGDGRQDIITGAGPGAGPHVRVFDGLSLAFTRLLREYYAFGAGFGGGVYVAAGDVTGDGKADIVVGAGPGAGPHVEVFDGPSGALLQSYYAYGNFDGGVRVATTTVRGGLAADVLTGPGPRAVPQARLFAGAGGNLLNSWFANDLGFLGGIFVGG